jgi:hypothetical protein
MTFEDIWNDIELETVIAVSNGRPPPSTNIEGIPYKAWKSHNFTGTLEEKIERNNWRYLRFEVLNNETSDQVIYLAYEIPEGGLHTFTLIGES